MMLSMLPSVIQAWPHAPCKVVAAVPATFSSQPSSACRSHIFERSCSAAALVFATISGSRERRRSKFICSTQRHSGSDQLLYNSLNREISKLSSGTKRQVDYSKRQEARGTQTRYGRSVSNALARIFGHRRQASGGRALEYSSDVPFSARFIGAMCLCVPLLAAIPYGASVFAYSPLLRELLLRPLLPWLRVFHSSRFSNFLGIIVIYGVVAKNRSMHSFARTLGMQASTLMMMQFPVNFLLQFLAAAPTPLWNLAQFTVFGYFMYCIFLGALSCVSGKPMNWPGIGDGRLSLPERGWRPSYRRSS